MVFTIHSSNIVCRPCPPPLWTDSTPRDSCVEVIQSVWQRWPSWARDDEFLLTPLERMVLNPTTFNLFFQAGWSVFGEVLTLPLLPEAPVRPSPSPQGWPVVVFSHGIGVNRASMSQLVYQLAR